MERLPAFTRAANLWMRTAYMVDEVIELKAQLEILQTKDQDKGTKADGQDEHSQRNGIGRGEGRKDSNHFSSSKIPTGARAPSFTLSSVMVDFMAYV